MTVASPFFLVCTNMRKYILICASMHNVYCMSVVIRVSPETRSLLKRTAAKDQTYDELIRESLDVYNALLEELETALHDPDDEWIAHEDLLKKLKISAAEIEAERDKVAGAD